jgi:signal transduction histidine kinase
MTTDRSGATATAIINDPGLGHEPEIIEAMTAAVTLLLENSRLSEALRASRTRVAHATQLERLRLERDLHDGAQQRLTAMQIKLSLVREVDDAQERDTRPRPRKRSTSPHLRRYRTP